jgi:hypothetical protein
MSVYLKGATERRRVEHNDRMSLAWHIARLNAYAPQKSDKFPKLADLQASRSGAQAKPKQTADQQIAAARAWMANRNR